MRPPILRRNPLAYPSGRNPGFDASHIMASPWLRFTGVASQGNWQSLNRPNIIAGFTGSGGVSPPTTLVNSAGPALGYGTAGQITAWNSGIIETPAAVTFGVIFTPLASATVGALISDGGGGANQSVNDTYMSCQSFIPCLNVANTLLNSGLSIVATIGQPAFFAASYNGSLANFVFRDLKTGIVRSASVSSALVIGTPTTGIYAIGSNFNASQFSNAAMSAAMYSATYSSLQQLLMWAQNPWDFWYPPTALDLTSEIYTVFNLPPPAAVLPMQSLIFV